MRLGLVDVGSQTVRFSLITVDGPGEPRPTLSWKSRLPLGDALDRSGVIDRCWIDRISRRVGHAAALARRLKPDEFVPFATAVVRDAPNRDKVVAAVYRRTGVRLMCFPPEQEARLSYLAARHWGGLSSGPMALLDIGGGTVEAAVGGGVEPAVAVSLPLGAGRVTRELLPGDPPAPQAIEAARAALFDAFDTIGDARRADFSGAYGVGVSKTLTQLARCAAAAAATRVQPDALHRSELQAIVQRLAGLTAKQRAKLPGISKARARQALGGALVCDAAMEWLGLTRLEICPWGIREGLALDRARAAA